MKWEAFKDHFEPMWGMKLRPFIESKECDEIYSFLKKRGSVATILPESYLTWRAFRETPFNLTRVVIIGQDPYHTVIGGIPVADGLAFSCGRTMKAQPSLETLLDAIEDDCHDGLFLRLDRNPDLLEWAKEGVLLLNYSLTTEAGNPGTHKDLWMPFYQYLLALLNKEKENLVFILMGKKAQSLEPLIDLGKHSVLCCEHPAAAGYGKRKMDHNGVFSKANEILREKQILEVDWARELPF